MSLPEMVHDSLYVDNRELEVCPECAGNWEFWFGDEQDTCDRCDGEGMISAWNQEPEALPWAPDHIEDPEWVEPVRRAA